MNRKLDQQSIASISDLGRLFSDTTILMHEAIARKAGLSGADHKYLGLVIQHGAMTAGDLAKRTGLTTGAITGLVDRLEKKKLVRRGFAADDRRKIVIIPNTEQATKLLGGTFAGLQQRMVSLLSTFSDNELEIIEKYLRSTTDVMKEVARNLLEIQDR